MSVTFLGFVDGTENPRAEAATEAVLIGDEDPVFAGGSYVIVQNISTILTAWNRSLDRGAGAHHGPH